MADRKSVRAELERKRIQLAQMRQERERRSRILQEDEALTHNSENRERVEDADAVLLALGLSTPLSRASTAPSNVSSLDQSRLNALSPDVATNQQQQFSPSLNDSFVTQPTSKQAVPLQVVHVNQINIAPRERVYYTKSTQTPSQAPIQNDQSVPQGDAPQQKSYYGKQHTPLNALPPTPRNASQSDRQDHLNTSKSSDSSNVQVAGVNPLALEWDDEFPGMSRVGIERR